MKKSSIPATNGDTQRAKWRDDPVAFIETVLIDPQSGKPFKLYREQVAFLERAFERQPDGRMRHTELLFSAPKKSGKTALAAMIAIYTAVVLAGQGGEIYCLANDREQSESRVYKAIVDILRASPLLRDAVVIGVHRITFKATASTVQSVANDYAGFSGSNPTMTCYDETAYFTGENSKRLWDEGIPSPARKISFRLSVSTAGFDGEASPLRDLYDRAMKGEVLRDGGVLGRLKASDLRRDGKLLCYWATTCKAPWQSKDWIEEQRATFAARPHQFARLIENAWTSNEDVFIPLEQWDACVDPSYAPILSDPRLDVWVGLDASVNRDSTAIVCCAWDAATKRVRLVRHRVFNPSKENPLDFENTIEREIVDLRSRFHIRQILFDPWQLVSVSQRMLKLGIPMEPLNQTSGNLTETGNTLLELVKYQSLVLYPDADMRVAVSRCVAKESSRGWRIAKTTASHKIDSIVALSLACLGAVRGGQIQHSAFQTIAHLDTAKRDVAAGVPVERAAATAGVGAQELTAWLERVKNGGAQVAARRTSASPAFSPAPVAPGARWNPWCGTLTEK